MARADIELLVNDALLLDTVEGLDSIAARLAVLAGHLERSRATAPAAGALTGMVVELGWWAGRLEGGLSDATAAALDRLATSDGA